MAKIDGVSINVTGIKQLDELFKSLKLSQQKSVLISAYRKATKPLIVSMRNNLLASTKTKASSKLYKSIGANPHRSLPILRIGARKRGGFGGFHAHLLEDGTSERMYTHKKSGKVHNTGSVKASNFFKNAVSSTEREVVGSVQDQIIHSLSMYIVKANAKSKT